MRLKRNRSAMTLVEILVVVAIAMILIGIAASVGFVQERKAKERLAAGEIDLIEAALEDFAAFRYRFDVPLETDPQNEEKIFYRSLKFPLDCNSFDWPQVSDEFQKVFTVSPMPDEIPEKEYMGSAVLYFFLNQVPQCRKTLERIEGKLVTNLNSYKVPVNIVIPTSASNKPVPFNRFVDPWGTPLRYDYYVNEVEETSSLTWYERGLTKRNFPRITSAGADKQFDTKDDIVSDK